MKKIVFAGVLALYLSLNLTGCITFMVASVISQQSVKKETKEAIREKKLPLVVTHLDTASPNSVGGVDCTIVFRNLSDQKLKYVTFGVSAINAVGDHVKCEIRKSDLVNLKVTGPVSIDNFQPPINRWDNCWYNSSIREGRIVYIDVVFMDGTEKRYNKEESQQMMRSYYEGK